MSRNWMLFEYKGLIVGREITEPGNTDIFKSAYEKCGYRYLKTVKQPSMKTLEKWAMDSVGKALDGCKIEHDNRCPHGAPSWVSVIGAD